MSVLNFIKVDGTQTSAFQLAATAGGVVLKNNSGALIVKATGGSTDTTVTASEYFASGDTGLVINSDATSSGADWTLSLARPATGMTAAWTLTLPPNAGSPNQVLQTNGSGVTTWVDAASGATDVTDTTNLAFGSGGTVAMFTLPANAVIMSIGVIVDTAFDGSGPTPSMSVGISADHSKYVGSADVQLAEAAGWWIYPNLPADVSSEALVIYFTAGGGASVGAARVLVSFCIPS